MEDGSGTIPEFEIDRVLFHGSGLLAVDKPAGLAVHGGTGHRFGLVESISEWVRLNPGVLDVKPGRRLHLIHRIDREASGVVLIALRAAIARRVQPLLAAAAVRHRYLAVVAGPLPEDGRLEGKVRSKLRGVYRHLPAALEFRRLRGDDRLSLVEVTPEGGRTHLVRALFAQANRPLAGDLRYGRPGPARKFLERFDLPLLLLHAVSLTLPEEVLGGERLLEAPIPEEMRRVCREKGWGDPFGEEGAEEGAEEGEGPEVRPEPPP